MVGVPYWQWKLGMGEDDNGEPDVEEVLKNSLL